MIPPRILKAMREAHACAIDDVGKATANVQKAATAAVALDVNAKIAAGADKLDFTPEERALFDEIYGSNDVLRERFDAMREGAQQQLVEAQQYLVEVEEDLKMVDPDFGVDKGPELPLDNGDACLPN